MSTWYGITETAVTSRQREFVEKYEKRFPGAKASGDASFAYDDVYILATALRYCATKTTVDSGCLADSLSRTDYQGVSGRVTFDDTGASTRDVLLMKIVGGKWQEI